MSHLKMKRLYVFVTVCLTLLVFVSAIVLNTNRLQASSLIQVDKEKLPPPIQDESGEFWDYILVPLLVAPNEYYNEAQLDTQFLSSIGFLIAQMDAKRAADVSQVSVYMADSSKFENTDEIGFRILSSIHYQFKDGSNVYVSTTLLSPAALDSALAFSGDAISLESQGEAWLDKNVNLDETPYNINFIKDNLIITVTGNVPMEELLSIADELVYE
jgi:hypothetical protein